MPLKKSLFICFACSSSRDNETFPTTLLHRDWVAVLILRLDRIWKLIAVVIFGLNRIWKPLGGWPTGEAWERVIQIWRNSTSRKPQNNPVTRGACEPIRPICNVVSRFHLLLSIAKFDLEGKDSRVAEMPPFLFLHHIHLPSLQWENYLTMKNMTTRHIPKQFGQNLGSNGRADQGGFHPCYAPSKSRGLIL